MPVTLRTLHAPDDTEAELVVEARHHEDDRGDVVLQGRWQEAAWTIDGATDGVPPDPLAETLRALVETCRAERPAPVTWWVEEADDGADAAARAAGLHADRELLQLRIPLPTPPGPAVTPPPGPAVTPPPDPAITPPPDPAITTRPFVVGRDEAAWLAVNNAAFSWHEDQADWTTEDLQRVVREPWFDPAGFLLHEEAGRLLGFCWTKVHADTAPPMGEIFVIAVDPSAHGRGLGRALTLAGLAHLADQGLRVGMLYVEDDNLPARRLYADLGFTEHHRRRRYSG